MTQSPTPDVLILGAGAAGLAAAVALSGAGASVCLLERKPFVGGRAYSYTHPALNEVIDSQHVLLGCCTNLIDLCRLAGSAEHIRWYDRITFLEPSRADAPARRSEIAAGSLPAPAHNTLSFLRAPMLSLVDKSRIAIGLLEFLRGYPARDDEPFSAWLRRTRQSERAIRHFWEPIVVGTLNDTFERCSTRYAGQVFHESFLNSAAGGRFGIPSQPLSEFYGWVARLAQQQGTVLRYRTSVERMERLPNGLWQVVALDGCGRVARHTGPNLILALPFEQTARLLATLPEGSPQRQHILPLLQHFTHAPITTIHLWLDREVTDLEHAAFLDTRIQWLFNKSAIRGKKDVRRLEGVEGVADGENRLGQRSAQGPAEGHYLELVISASHAEIQQRPDEILRSAMAELASFFPEVRRAKLLKSTVLKEARATFSVTPGLDRFRPKADAPGENLFLAGDWTESGWPSTMEGAVRSGRLAAEAVARATGNDARFLVPGLPPTGLTRWLSVDR
ncbi:MAG: hydroxysqualene dehydroxylase HpnE [Acidobacteriaceae bacterium]